jgi:hypothetical protein
MIYPLLRKITNIKAKYIPASSTIPKIIKMPPLQGVRKLEQNSAKPDLSEKEKPFTLFRKIVSLSRKIGWRQSVEKFRREVIESAREMGFTSYDASY